MIIATLKSVVAIPSSCFTSEFTKFNAFILYLPVLGFPPYSIYLRPEQWELRLKRGPQSKRGRRSAPPSMREEQTGNNQTVSSQKLLFIFIFFYHCPQSKKQIRML